MALDQSALYRGLLTIDDQATAEDAASTWAKVYHEYASNSIVVGSLGRASALQKAAFVAVLLPVLKTSQTFDTWAHALDAAVVAYWTAMINPAFMTVAVFVLVPPVPSLLYPALLGLPTVGLVSSREPSRKYLAAALDLWTRTNVKGSIPPIPPAPIGS